MNASNMLVETLMDWGVEVIFGLPGDGINGIMEALRVRQDKIRFIQVRHEEAAAFMACAYSKYTGKLGVCLATSGPRGIHLLDGLYDAEVDGKSAGMPSDADLAKAARVLDEGKKIAILAGRGALKATDELERLADRLAAPIIKPLLGKACVPDDSPFTTGGIGLLGTAPSQEAIENCDTLFMIGTSFPYMEFLPKPGSARGVQLDVDAVRIGLRYPVEVGLVGDSRRTLQQLLPMLNGHEDRRFLQKAQERMKDWWELMEQRGTRSDKPMKPQVVAWELGKRLRSDAIVSSDSGTIATWFARQIPARRG